MVSQSPDVRHFVMRVAFHRAAHFEMRAVHFVMRVAFLRAASLDGRNSLVLRRIAFPGATMNAPPASTTTETPSAMPTVPVRSSTPWHQWIDGSIDIIDRSMDRYLSTDQSINRCPVRRNLCCFVPQDRCVEALYAPGVTINKLPLLSGQHVTSLQRATDVRLPSRCR